MKELKCTVSGGKIRPVKWKPYNHVIWETIQIQVWKYFTCLWSGECLRWSPVVPIEGLCRTTPKSTLIAPHPWLGLGVWGCSNITLLTHFDGPTVTVFSCQDKWVLTTWEVEKMPFKICMIKKKNLNCTVSTICWVETVLHEVLINVLFVLLM